MPSVSISKLVTSRSAFFFLLIVGLILASLDLYKTYRIISNYENPSPLQPWPVLFEYLAYAFIAFIFPWSWRLSNVRNHQVAAAIISGLIFVLAYLFLANLLEWTFSPRSYSLWLSYIFTITHSGPILVAIYAVLATVLYYLGITRNGDNPEGKYLQRIPYKLRNTTFFFNIIDICFFEANDNYVVIHNDIDRPQLIRMTLNKLEGQLDPIYFRRIHRKYIINLAKVASTAVSPGGGETITLQNGARLAVSRTYKADFKAAQPQV